MTPPRVALLGSMEQELRKYLQDHPEGHERAAIVLFRRFHSNVGGLPASDRYVAVEVHPFQDEWLTGSSPSHVAFDMKHMREFFRRCDEEFLIFGFVHNHPGGYPEFSDVDEDNEQTLLKALTNRNGRDVHFVAMLWTNNEWKARVRHGATPSNPSGVRHILVLSDRIGVYLGHEEAAVQDEMAMRQAAAFGEPFVRKMRSLRAAIVGAGGTGSPTATLLARSGLGELVVIDNDRLEASNLNRVRGARKTDVGKNKAALLRDYIDSLGLTTKVACIDTLVDKDPRAIDALASCDMIFGCTDDQIGREVLNTAVYVYAQPYVDVGLGGQVDQRGGQPYLRYHFGRVSTLLPEFGECLFCQGILRDAWIRHQYAIRDNPNLTEAEARERYLQGGGEQAPGVGPFTSAVADYGVATLFDLLAAFRRFPPELRRDLFTIDFVRMELRSPQQRGDAGCPYCAKRDYLLMKERYRLNRPALGKPHATH